MYLFKLLLLLRLKFVESNKELFKITCGICFLQSVVSLIKKFIEKFIKYGKVNNQNHQNTFLKFLSYLVKGYANTRKARDANNGTYSTSLHILECCKHCLPLSSSQIVYKEQFGEINIGFSIEVLSYLPITSYITIISPFLHISGVEQTKNREDILRKRYMRGQKFILYLFLQNGPMVCLE